MLQRHPIKQMHLHVLHLTFLISSVFSHTWLLSPTSRYQNTCLPAYDNSNCCARRPGSVATTYTRGQIVSTNWGRNNHVGGFIRWSIVPLTASDTLGVFDNDSNVFQYNCYAPQCVGNGGGFFAGDPPGTPFNGIRCSMNIQIPTWLPDGAYTIQWRWHSGGDSFNIRNLGLVDYVACHDFNVNGGTLASKPQCPLFIGGDASNPNANSCEFFKWNDINACTRDKPYEPDNNCYGWYAQAPPKAILNCPSNILPGGMTAALNRNFSLGQPLDLFIGNTKNTIRNPGTESVNLAAIREQLLSAPSTSTVTPTPSLTSSFPSSPAPSHSDSHSSTPSPTTTPPAPLSRHKLLTCIKRVVLSSTFKGSKHQRKELLCQSCKIWC